jgi:hypothetical protein
MARAARSGDAQGFESTSLAANGYRHANAFVLPVFPRGAASASASGIRVARVRPRSLSISYMIREPAAGKFAGMARESAIMAAREALSASA